MKRNDRYLRTAVVPEAAVVGALSAQLSHSRSGPAMFAQRRYCWKSRKLRCRENPASARIACSTRVVATARP